MGIGSFLTANPAIVGGLIGGASAIMVGLIVRSTARGSSRTQRTDEYRREVRSAASSIVRAARPFLDAARAFERSIFWDKGTARTRTGHDESFRACQTAMAEFEEKIADFRLLVDIDMLSGSAAMASVHAKLAYDAIENIQHDSGWTNFTEAQLDNELEQIRKYAHNLEKKVLPEFRKCVHKYMPHTIVGAKRRHERILRPVTASWRWLMDQHRKNLAPSPAKQKPPAQTGPPPAHDSATPAAEDHLET